MTDSYRQFSLALLTIGCLLAPMTEVKAQSNPPTDVTTTIDLPAGGYFGCQFPVQLLITGKGKQVNLPGNRTLFTSPQLKVAVINTTNSKQANFVITGAYHLPPPNSDGTQTYVVTGRNLLGDPVAGFVLVSGSFRFTIDASGNATEPLNGNGKVTKVCPLIQ